MEKKEHKISKVSRILSIYHLFCYCEEVSFKEVTDLMPVSRKTVERDIALLKAAGLLNVRFSKRTHAFVPVEGIHMTCRLPPVFPESKAKTDSMTKILRLTHMMDEMDGADDPDDEEHPIGSYYCDFPNSTYSLETFL